MEETSVLINSPVLVFQFTNAMDAWKLFKNVRLLVDIFQNALTNSIMFNLCKSINNKLNKKRSYN